VFIFLLLVMVLLATTELGTDSWISALLTPVMSSLGENAGNWVLVYTSFVMFCLRFFAGPVAHKLTPLGLLLACSAIASLGLFSLAHAGTSAFLVVAAATFYAFGKSFFWPTTLGLVSEQFPRGGALTLNAIAGVGMISVGVLGGPFLGTLQDVSLDKNLRESNPALHAIVAAPPQGKFGLHFQPLDKTKIAALPESDQAAVGRIIVSSNQHVLAEIAILPALMFICYVGLGLYFRRRGGYHQVDLR
jgi:MFS family permease